MLFPVINVNAGNSYIQALREIGKIAPLDEEGVIKDYAEDVKPDVEFDMNDVKFLKLTLKDSLIIALNSNYDIRIAKMDPTIKEKDINEMILSGKSKQDIQYIINQNTYSGLSALTQLNTYKRI